MSITITEVVAIDVRFPTSESLDGSDAMNQAPDYSAAYVTLRTDQPSGPEGHGITFTTGRGNELCVAAVESLRHLVVGQTLESIVADFAGFWYRLVGDGQLRWVGPEKGVIHLATAAIVNALWDLYAKVEGKPLWKLLIDMTPEELVQLIPFRYISDALTPDEALDILRRQAPTRAIREAEMRSDGYPAYTTSIGWIGYSDEKMRRLCREGVAAGWQHFKVKVGNGPRRRHPPARDRPRGDRSRPLPHDRRQPGMGRRPGHRLGTRARTRPTVVDRGADQPR